VFIKNGEHILWTFFFSLILMFKVIDIITVSNWIYLWLIGQRIWHWDLVTYTMIWVLRNDEIRFWHICFFGIFDINMRSIWIWILPGIYKVEKLKRGISLYVFSRLFWCVVKYGFEICDLKVLILICTQFGFWFGFTYDYK